MDVADGFLILLMLLFAISGYRQGFVIGALSFGGFFTGALIGLQLGPLLAKQFSNGAVRIVVSLVVIFGLAVLGQTLAGWWGTQLRHGIKRHRLRRADDAGGVVISVVAVLMVAWLIAVPLKSTSVTWLNREVRSSAILGMLNQVLPHEAQALSSALRTTLDTNEFPEVFTGRTPADIRDVDPPDPALAASPVVQNSHRSVVKLHGDAPSCARRIDGSGFVYAPQRVLTNAHVVAGTREVEVETPKERLQGTVVLFDPARDIAVLYVEGLQAPTLPFAPAPEPPGGNAIVLGYPMGGPYDAESARVGDLSVRPGVDIYDTRKDVTREIYSIRSLVRGGNSGGPLITPDGNVLGMVFAAARDDKNIGYALSARELAGSAAEARTMTEPVETRDCS